MDINCIVIIFEYTSSLQDIIRLCSINKHYNNLLQYLLNSEDLIHCEKYDPKGWWMKNTNIIKTSIWHASLAIRFNIKSCYTISLMDTKNLYISMIMSYSTEHDYLNKLLHREPLPLHNDEIIIQAVLSDNIGLIIKLLKFNNNPELYKRVMRMNITDKMTKAITNIIPNYMLSTIEEFLVINNNLKAMEFLMKKYNNNIGLRLLNLCNSIDMFRVLLSNKKNQNYNVGKAFKNYLSKL